MLRRPAPVSLAYLIGGVLLFFARLSAVNAAPAPVLAFSQSTPGTVVAMLTITNNGCGGIGSPTSITQSGNQFHIDSPIGVPPPGCVPGPIVIQTLAASLPPGGSLADGTYDVQWTAGGGIFVAQGSFALAGGLLAPLPVPTLGVRSLIVLALLVVAGGFAGLARSRAKDASAAR